MKRLLGAALLVALATAAAVGQVVVDNCPMCPGGSGNRIMIVDSLDMSASTDPCECGDPTCTELPIPFAYWQLFINTQYQCWAELHKHQRQGGYSCAAPPFVGPIGGPFAATRACTVSEPYKDSATLWVVSSGTPTFQMGSWGDHYVVTAQQFNCTPDVGFTHYITIYATTAFSATLAAWAVSPDTMLTIYLGKLTSGTIPGQHPAGQQPPPVPCCTQYVACQTGEWIAHNCPSRW